MIKAVFLVLGGLTIMRLRRSFVRSQSLTPSRRTRNIFFSFLILINSDVIAKPDYSEELEKGLLVPFKTGKKIINGEESGSASIETKGSKLKIDTKDAESMRLAAEFRKNYKKSSECLEPANEEINIKCANEYIKARKETIK